MTNRPMGFGPEQPDDDASAGGTEPGRPDHFAALFGRLTEDPQALAEAIRSAGLGDVGPDEVRAMISQVQRMLGTPGLEGPVNWEVAVGTARQVVSEHGDPSVSDAQRRAVDQALRLADTWLTGCTALPAAGARSVAWSAAEWVEGTQEVWRRLVEPVAERVANAMSDALDRQVRPEQAEGDTGFPSRTDQAAAAAVMMRQVGGSVFGLQVGQAIGTLATEVVSGTEIGLPLVGPGSVVLLPSGVSAFGAGLDVPDDEVRLYLAVREAARARLFAHVPWLSAALVGSVQDYASGLVVDADQIDATLAEVGHSDPETLQHTLADGLFTSDGSAGQRAAVVRLETMLALLEGWVEVVTDEAAAALPHATALRESVRRRRASGGPAEQTFSTLVGLGLRPRRLRDAAALWTIIGRELGRDGRDGVWAHPDLMPGADDLDDPLGFAERRSESTSRDADIDAAIQQLLADSPNSAETPDGADEARSADDPTSEDGSGER